MKKNNLIFALALSVGVLFYACGNKETKDSAPEVTEAQTAINTTHQFICPMNCENSASNEPGQCKVCGMDLVSNPNYAGAADTSAILMDTTGAGMSQDTVKADGHNHDNHEGHNH